MGWKAHGVAPLVQGVHENGIGFPDTPIGEFFGFEFALRCVKERVRFKELQSECCTFSCCHTPVIPRFKFSKQTAFLYLLEVPRLRSPRDHYRLGGGIQPVPPVLKAGVPNAQRVRSDLYIHSQFKNSQIALM